MKYNTWVKDQIPVDSSRSDKQKIQVRLTMWFELICCVVVYLFVRLFFYEDDTILDSDSSHFNALFTVARRLENLYRGTGKVFVGLQIPDPDSAVRRNIDLVLLTNQEAVVIHVKNISGFVSTDKDGNWICSGGKHHKTELLPNPVGEARELIPVLQEYLEQRGVTDLPEGCISFKIICPNPKFRSIDSDSFPPEVITYDQWKTLKPDSKTSYAGWIKGALGKKKMQDSLFEKLNSVLSTAPISDRLELKGERYVLGEFIEFKGKQEDLHALRKVKRSKVSHLSVQKISMFGLAHTTLQVLYYPRDYRAEGFAGPSQFEEFTVRSSTEIVFQPRNSEKSRKYRLSKVTTMSLSA